MNFFWLCAYKGFCVKMYPVEKCGHKKREATPSFSLHNKTKHTYNVLSDHYKYLLIMS